LFYILAYIYIYEDNIFVLLLALLIVYINQVNVVETLKDKIYLYIFNSLSILFVLIFLYYSFVFGFKRGLFSTFIIWCLFVVATPIPEAGLLVSVPLKNILNIDMGITQILVSFIALGFLIFLMLNFVNIWNKPHKGSFSFVLWILGHLVFLLLRF